jgi:hypothetical protein
MDREVDRWTDGLRADLFMDKIKDRQMEKNVDRQRDGGKRWIDM